MLVGCILEFEKLKITVQLTYLKGKRILETISIIEIPAFHYQNATCGSVLSTKGSVIPIGISTKSKNSTLNHFSPSKKPKTVKVFKTTTLS